MNPAKKCRHTASSPKSKRRLCAFFFLVTPQNTLHLFRDRKLNRSKWEQVYLLIMQVFKITTIWRAVCVTTPDISPAVILRWERMCSLRLMTCLSKRKSPPFSEAQQLPSSRERKKIKERRLRMVPSLPVICKA